MGHNACVTEIIAVDEFGGSADLASSRGGPFITDIEVLTALELDDLHDCAEESPWVLMPSCPAVRASRPAPRRARPPTHRKDPPAAGATQSRLLIVAFAAGALAAGANAAVDAPQGRTDPALVADTMPPQDHLPGASGIQIASVANTFDSVIHREEFSNAIAFAEERAQREARLRRPQFVFPALGILTSGFGTRWGTLHAGLDIANAVGTPIYAASDGEVIASGPTPGYGMWVKIRDVNGTVTLYGHIDTAIVQTGERVTAGDQIATIGNRGNSTGPHLHFEVHREGIEKTDPMSWLGERGVSGG
ncbi:M23 family metallopeptidase [Mycolicibacterium komossense]|uniref:M23 family metallopeptidase n=1 Tax=Mycolicibacterium komossense TaxID=1779 RepID=A0ABT3C923_9MYCO|nr:M23 family metallopeptidase [Mycolicibacterium komossense]MCV7225953.1 M23 family metallopeptidase [Mycolicibacterium komossense]